MLYETFSMFIKCSHKFCVVYLITSECLITSFSVPLKLTILCDFRLSMKMPIGTLFTIELNRNYVICVVFHLIGWYEECAVYKIC